MSADWLTILLVIVGVVIAWKVFKGVVKTAVLVAILISAGLYVSGGLE